MEDLKYPIYIIRCDFDEIAYPGNSVSGTVSFIESKTDQELQEYADQWWESIIAASKNKDKGFVLKDIKITLVDTETWYLQWFCHTSLTRYDNETDAFNSFKRFLERKDVRLNYGSQNYPSDDGYMAMGGEDLARWEYCTCPGCVDKSITTITH